MFQKLQPMSEKDTIVTLSKSCLVGKGCIRHTHYQVVNRSEPIHNIAIFARKEDYIIPDIFIFMEKKYSGDSITPTSSPYLIHPAPYQRMEIKPKTVVNCDHNIDAPIMGMLFSFTILLTAYWLYNSLASWGKLYSDLRRCLSYTS
jgi:hypothetical protein